MATAQVDFDMSCTVDPKATLSLLRAVNKNDVINPCNLEFRQGPVMLFSMQPEWIEQRANDRLSMLESDIRKMIDNDLWQ